MKIISHSQTNKKGMRDGRVSAHSAEAGFTIVEVLVSLLIFSVAIMGVITIASQGSLNIDDSKLSLTASYLADEGVELMRDMRDTAVDTSIVTDGSTGAAGWASFTSVVSSSACTTASPCDIDPTIPATPFPSLTGNIVTCASAGYCPLYVLSSGNYTDFSSGVGATLSPYSRKITVAPVGTSGNEVQVTVTVEYTEGVATKSVTDTEDLFNYY